MTLLLDPDIRDWVVLPLFVIIVVAGLLRQEVSAYLAVSSSGGGKAPTPAAVQRAHSLLQQCRRLYSPATVAAFPTTSSSSNAASSSSASVTTTIAARLPHAVALLRAEAARLEREHERQQADGGANGGNGSAAMDPMEAMMKNPMGMLGGNMVFMVQNMVMMQGIQHFFSGFILLRVPFPLTLGFRSMFQKGVADLPHLEPSYVSSVSWYFLVLYGLRSFFSLVAGRPSLEQREQDQYLLTTGLQPAPSPTAPKQDAEALAKLLNAEADALELLWQSSSKVDSGDNVEKRLLGKARYPKRKKLALLSPDADFLLGGGGGKRGTPTSSKATKKKQ